MNLPPYRQVLECASPLALSALVRGRKSGRGLPQSKTLARLRRSRRGSWSQCMRQSERRLSMNRPTPDPSREGSKQSSAARKFPSSEGLEVGSGAQGAACGREKLSRPRQSGRERRDACPTLESIRFMGQGVNPSSARALPACVERVQSTNARARAHYSRAAFFGSSEVRRASRVFSRGL